MTLAERNVKATVEARRARKATKRQTAVSKPTKPSILNCSVIFLSRLHTFREPAIRTRHGDSWH